jgi:hypothetical protein
MDLLEKNMKQVLPVGRAGAIGSGEISNFFLM